MEGWEYFERTFLPSESGGYNLILEVWDDKDEDVPSYLAVDGLEQCAGKPISDINNDCHVNFK